MTRETRGRPQSNYGMKRGPWTMIRGELFGGSKQGRCPSCLRVVKVVRLGANVDDLESSSLARRCLAD